MSSASWRISFCPKGANASVDVYLSNELGVLSWREGPGDAGLDLTCTRMPASSSPLHPAPPASVWQVRGAFKGGARVHALPLPKACFDTEERRCIRVDVDPTTAPRRVLSGIGAISALRGGSGDLAITTLRPILLPGALGEIVVEEATSQLGLGGSVWDCALVLIEYLVSQPPLVRGRRCLDLGAGTGVVGIVAAALGARCTLADTPAIASLTRANVERNQHLLAGTAEVRGVAWGNDATGLFPPFDVVLLSDVTYDLKAMPALCRTLTEVCLVDTQVLLAHRSRGGDDQAAFEMLDTSFARRSVDGRFAAIGGAVHPDIALFALRLRRA